jgi:DNA excision repair protein ERCC-4
LQANRIGFIKGLSDNAEQLTAGFFKIEKVMKCLYVKTLWLYPRFHLGVKTCLDAQTIEVVEVFVDMSPAMERIQQLLLELSDACIQELKRMNKTLDVSEWTVEGCLFKTIDLAIRRQLDPLWHSVSPQTKRLVADLRTMRKLVDFLGRHDCVSF